MPINFLGSVFVEGVEAIPYWEQIKTYGPYVAGAGLVKRYFGGTMNTWERKMNGSVIMITGGTSGLGAVVAKELARQGCQIILLVRRSDQWLLEYVDDMREDTGNPLIYVEECDLGDFYSIRKFATKWLDNSPPRRLDQIICCAGVAVPPGVGRTATKDGIEQHLQLNYMGHYHLLTLLSPAIRAQPPDRDVRVILTTCIAGVMADFDLNDLEFTNRRYPTNRPWRVLGAAKLSLAMFAYEFQKRINEYERPDKMPNNVHVSVVDPGMMRSPSFKRFVSCGSIFGLLIYLVLWPLWWLFMKTSIQGAQSHLYASMSPDPTDNKVNWISECKIRPHPPRKELKDDGLQKELYDFTEQLVLDTEKKSIIARKRLEKQQEKDGSSTAQKKSSTKEPSKDGTSTAQKKSSTKKRK